MKPGKKCCCFFAAFLTFVIVVLITYITGYSMNNWTLATWLAAFFVALTGGFCMRCGQAEDEKTGKSP